MLLIHRTKKNLLKILNAESTHHFRKMRADVHFSPPTQPLGIIKKNGAMAEYVTVPVNNPVEIPPSISDTDAIFIEPLAAALEILEQVRIGPENNVLLIGDGKLALLIARAVHTTGCT